MKCYVCESGWIVVGNEWKNNDFEVILHNAAVVRSWNNGKGIGGISKAENKSEYTLDDIGDATIMRSKILFVIPCDWERNG